jgi:RNA polymerase sigma factor for flagellar operon FliA
VRGGPEEDAKFVAQYAPLVRSIAHKIRAGLDLNCDLEELVSFGFAGLVEARSRFDPSRGVQFNTFSYYRIRGAILDGVRAMAYLPAHIHAARKAAEASDTVLEDAGDAKAQAPPGTKPTKEDAARAIDALLGKMTASYVLASLGQDASARPPSPEEALIESSESERIRAALHVLPERERTLIEGFYFEGRLFDAIAKDLGISKSWASRLHTKALAMLREAIEAE